jgi:cysteine-rich repeat protein
VHRGVQEERLRRQAGQGPPAETCDDGNKINGDGCSVNCVAELKCDGKLYKCGNGLDDDADGKIDLKDPECTSPCDDDEKSFQTSLPGQNLDCKSDCYWDANSGAGEDKCDWNLKCDPQNPGDDIGCKYDPGQKMCMMTQGDPCLDFCVPLIPNGCDCFGCCEISGKFVYLNSNPQCNLANLAACNSCTFNEQCANTCDARAVRALLRPGHRRPPARVRRDAHLRQRPPLPRRERLPEFQLLPDRLLRRRHPAVSGATRARPRRARINAARAPSIAPPR